MNEVLKGKAIAPFRPDDVRAEYGIAHSWSVKDGDRSGEGFYLLGKARNIKEFNTAVSLIDGMALNFVYSDGENIGWIPSGKIPLRKSGEGKFPSPGWTGLYDWKGYLPYEEKPQKLNPAQGFIVTANNRVVEGAYPHITSSWYGARNGRKERQRCSKKKRIKLTLIICVKCSLTESLCFMVKSKKFYFREIFWMPWLL